MESNDRKLTVFEIPDLFKVPDPVFTYEEACRDKTIVVDNGSYECKAGWSFDTKPRMVFRNHSTKVRGQKGSDIYVGNDIANYEASGWMPMKSPFEKNIVTHPEIQEHIMDHIFTHLGFSSEQDKIDHPIVMTEPLCNPNYYRQFIAELLFECYDVPSVMFGIDSVLSLEYNIPDVQDALVIGLGHSVSQVVPVLNGEIGFKQARRVSYGGQNISGYLQRLLQLKHPHLTVAIGAIKSEYLTHTYCRYALDYEEQVLRFCDPVFADEHTIRVQLPLNSVQTSTSATTTSGKMDVCLAIVHRVECVMSRRYKAKWIHSQEKLKQMLLIQEIVTAEEDSRMRAKLITDLGFDSLDEIEAAISELQQKVDLVLQSELPPEVELCHFSDPDSWLAALRRAREDLTYRISQAELNNLPHKPSGEVGARISDVDMLDRIELIIFETEREFKRSTVLNTDNLNSSAGISQFYQLVLGTERYRAPEVLFQPSAMLGLDQAGIVETIDRVLQQLSPDEQNKVAERIFVTGGPATLPGLKERLEREIRALRPFGIGFNVIMAKDAALDAWNGARMVALNESLKSIAVTKKDYDELGPDYIKNYKCSNVYAPSPLVVRI